jgi:hypothetical protein
MAFNVIYNNENHTNNNHKTYKRHAINLLVPHSLDELLGGIVLEAITWPKDMRENGDGTRSHQA